jgi:hypothetical protein
MNELITILGTIVTVAYLGFQLSAPLLMKRKLERIKLLHTDELRDLFTDQSKSIFFGAAANELNERGENLTFTLPVFLDLALSRNMALSVIGKGSLKLYFSDAVKDIDLDKTFLPKESKSRLKNLKHQIDELTKT